jgi:hypothetical protein
LFPASYRRFAGSMRNLRRRRDLISPEETNTDFLMAKDLAVVRS